MSQFRKKLTDIISEGTGNGGNFRSKWERTVAADDFGPLPPGEYVVRCITGELFQAKKGTPGYKLTMEVTEGDYQGRKLWLDFWLTEAALPNAKRDLAKIGITRPEQLEEPLPAVYLLRAKVKVRKDDEGNETNKVASFESLGIEPGDAFEPKDSQDDSFPFGKTGGQEI